MPISLINAYFVFKSLNVAYSRIYCSRFNYHFQLFFLIVFFLILKLQRNRTTMDKFMFRFTATSVRVFHIYETRAKSLVVVLRSLLLQFFKEFFTQKRLQMFSNMFSYYVSKDDIKFGDGSILRKLRILENCKKVTLQKYSIEYRAFCLKQKIFYKSRFSNNKKNFTLNEWFCR